MIEHLNSICKANGIKFYWFNNKWYLEGDAGIITRCLRSTRANQIIVEGKTYDLDPVCKFLATHFEIKFAFDELKQ